MIGGLARFAFPPQLQLALKLLPYLAIGALLVFAVIQTMNAKHYKKRYENEQQAHVLTVDRFKQAQAAAALQNKAHVARIESQFAKIAEQSEVKYEKMLVDSRASVDRFVRRQQATKRPSEIAGTGQSAEVLTGIVEAGEVSDVPRGFVLLPVSDLELSAEAFAKLAALQDAALAVSEVETRLLE